MKLTIKKIKPRNHINDDLYSGKYYMRVMANKKKCHKKVSKNQIFKYLSEY